MIMGRVGSDAVLRKSKKGASFAHFSVATTRYWPDEVPNPEGKTHWNEKTTWHQIVVWGRQADFCGQGIKKGMPVFVDGELRGRTYETGQGDKRYQVEVHAETVSLLGALTSLQKQGERATQSQAPGPVESELEEVGEEYAAQSIELTPQIVL
jgi:single-strand DNA-binding protein